MAHGNQNISYFLVLVIVLLHAKHGTPAVQHELILEFPWLASVRLRGFHVCAAAVLGSEWLLTAAHCVEGQIHEWVTAHVGSSSLNPEGKVYRAASIIIHPRFDPRNMDNNIALVKVAEPMLDGSGVTLASDDVSSGTHILALSWFHNSKDASAIEIRVVENEICNVYGNLTPRMFCLGRSPRTTQSLCNSGGGGPLVLSGELVGMVSHGGGCRRSHNKKVPTVATKVLPFLRWIHNQTELITLPDIVMTLPTKKLQINSTLHT